MQDIQIQPHPFALMLNPQQVLQAIETSAPLSSLRRRIYRPLDKPLLGSAKTGEPVEIDDMDETEGPLASDFGVEV